MAMFARSLLKTPRLLKPRQMSSLAKGQGAAPVGLLLAATALGAGAGYLYYKHESSTLDYQKVYSTIADKLEGDYDDGSFGPVLLRLSWHACGTYDAKTKTGGSNGATMRFSPESQHGANAGLSVARDFLEPIKQQYPQITYADLWVGRNNTVACWCSCCTRDGRARHQVAAGTQRQ